MTKKKICVVIGTRPEAIKMAPVVLDLLQRDWAEVIVLCTSQHRNTVLPILDFFNVRVHYDLDVMEPNQDLASLTARLMQRVAVTLKKINPDVVLVQGDTTTVFATALCCFYQNISFGHVEAGLRSGRMDNPFPEEFNRVATDLIATWHFVPTSTSYTNLSREIPNAKSIYITGNTVIDALQIASQRERQSFLDISSKSRLLLVTLHRRENHGAPLIGILKAIRELVDHEKNLEILFPVHPNPNVSVPVNEILYGHPRIHLMPPLDYPELVAALKKCVLVLTDSGGIQEEAPAFGKPVLVARLTTERPEAVEAGVAELVGTDSGAIVSRIRKLLHNEEEYSRMSVGASPYGDGQASKRIGDILAKSLGYGRRPHASSPTFSSKVEN